jgi:hypothetical protein
MRIHDSWSILASLALGGCTGTTVPPAVGCDASCSTLWSLDLGGSQNSAVNLVGADGSGNVILEASLTVVTSLPNGPVTYAEQTFLAKLDPAGQVVWKKQLPFTGGGTPLMTVGAGGEIVLFGSLAAGVVIDLGGGPLSPAGPGLDTMYVAEFDASGNHVMSRALHEVTGDPTVNESYGAIAAALALDPSSGAIVVAGDYWGPLDLGDGQLGYSPDVLVTNTFVMKLAPSGALLWSQHFGDQPDASATSDDTGMFVGGVTVDTEGSILLAIGLFGTVVVGTQTIASAGASDILVAKLDPSGGLVFAEGFGGPGSDGASAIATGPDGAIFFTGLTTGTVDFGSVALPTPAMGGSFVTALEPDGQVRWSVLGPSIFAGAGMGIGVDGAGGVEASFSQDEQLTEMALTKLDPATGAQSLARTIALSGTSLQGQLQLQSFAVDPLGNAVLGGGFHGVIDFGTGPLSMNEEYEISGIGLAAFVVKVAP